MKVKLEGRSRWSLIKRLLFIGNYYYYEMCCFKRKVSAPKSPKDSKAWCPLNFSLKYYNHNGIQYKNKKNSIKPKNYPKSKTLRVLNKLDID